MSNKHETIFFFMLGISILIAAISVSAICLVGLYNEFYKPVLVNEIIKQEFLNE